MKLYSRQFAGPIIKALTKEKTRAQPTWRQSASLLLDVLPSWVSPLPDWLSFSSTWLVTVCAQPYSVFSPHNRISDCKYWTSSSVFSRSIYLIILARNLFLVQNVKLCLSRFAGPIMKDLLATRKQEHSLHQTHLKPKMSCCLSWIFPAAKLAFFFWPRWQTDDKLQQQVVAYLNKYLLF